VHAVTPQGRTHSASFSLLSACLFGRLLMRICLLGWVFGGGVVLGGSASRIYLGFSISITHFAYQWSLSNAMSYFEIYYFWKILWSQILIL
jgi:hypothetical protein